MGRFRCWLINTYLPAYAKDALREENDRLRREITELRQEIAEHKSYIAGLETAMRYGSRVTVNMGDKDK